MRIDRSEMLSVRSESISDGVPVAWPLASMIVSMTVASTHPKYPIPIAVPPSVARYKSLSDVSIWIMSSVSMVSLVDWSSRCSHSGNCWV